MYRFKLHQQSPGDDTGYTDNRPIDVCSNIVAYWLVLLYAVCISKYS